ncbi:DUF6506 family protein [Embleya sp. NBC_00896]|uniref:DUF6506 family protein n=1 Tax=Embleya sp. NBC_00896 TaxID=2975961 RepID=UPI003868ED88|nr:DUF6506 family protein [Embleya sp. NBC_00896]
MALVHWGFIYTATDADPDRDTSIVDTGACRTVLVGAATPDQAVAAARRMVEDGVQLIELCGGFGPVGTARVIEAIGDAVPVGAVGYGPEAVSRVHAIFA